MAMGWELMTTGREQVIIERDQIVTGRGQTDTEQDHMASGHAQVDMR